jgi:hypothetical protein
MQHAQEYFAKVLPWPQDGDDPAYVNLHWSTEKLHPKTGKPFWSGRAVRSVKEAVSTVKWALSLSDVKDIYVCMSSQQEGLPKVSKAGHPYILPIRSQANAVAFKSLFMDLDAKGKSKDSYDTLAEAFAAFKQFLADVGLPSPNVIVKTGGGFHVYWTFDRALRIDEWQPLANALAAAARAHGLKCDTGCTIDAARILRVPSTFNRKLAVDRPVVLAGGRTGGDYSLARLETALAPYVSLALTKSPAKSPPAFSVLPQLTPLTGGNDLSAGVELNAGPPIELKDVAKECAFINEAVTSGGKDFANPLWNLTTLISTFTSGERADAHLMAGGHADYDKATTDDLYDRKASDRKAKGLGWPACRTIHNNGFAGCPACPHFVANRSPLAFGATQLATTLPATATALNGAQGNSIPDLPIGYSRRADGVVCQILVNEDGTHSHEPICNYPMSTPSIQVYPIYTLNFSTVTESGRTTQIVVPTGDLSAKDSMRRCLLKQGVALKEHESKRVMEFFMSWIEKLQQTKSMVVSSSPYGWSTDSKSNVEGFVYGGNLWMPTGDRAAANPDPVLARRYKPTGAVDPWVAAAKLITDQKRPALEAIIASAFAAPLVRFCHEPGVLMSTYSTASGIGKTSAMRIAQAVWGHPQRAMQGLDDTSNFVFGKIGQLQNLPLYWDELKSEEDTKRFVKIVFNLTKQKEKDRMTQNATMRESGSWQTLLVSASNDSIMNFVVQQTKQTAAGIYRLFEYEVPAPTSSVGQIDQADFSRVVGRLDDNYGHIGLQYARYLGSNHASIEKDVEAFYKAIGNEVNTVNEERYWRVMLACLLKGAEYANKLGFTNIDGHALKKFLFKVVDDLRNERNDAPVDLNNALNVSNVLAQFLNAHRSRHTLRTNRIHIGRGKPAKGTIAIKTISPDRLEAIRVHIGEDDKMIRISKTYLQDWLGLNGYSPAAVTKAMIAEFGAVALQGRLCSGTEYAGSAEYLLEMDLTKNNHTNFIDEA